MRRWTTASRSREAARALLALLCLAACADPTPSFDDGVDAGPSARCVPPDAGTRSGVLCPPGFQCVRGACVPDDDDGDRDGFGLGIDCDDGDPAVGRTFEEVCGRVANETESTCLRGRRVCMDAETTGCVCEAECGEGEIERRDGTGDCACPESRLCELDPSGGGTSWGPWAPACSTDHCEVVGSEKTELMERSGSCTAIETVSECQPVVATDGVSECRWQVRASGPLAGSPCEPPMTGYVQEGCDAASCVVHEATCSADCEWIVGAPTTMPCTGLMPECADSSSETRMRIVQDCEVMGQCGWLTEQRTCDGTTCTWDPWVPTGSCVPTECCPGAERSTVTMLPCGNCGYQTEVETCTASGAWGAPAPGPCAMEGVCSPAGPPRACTAACRCGTVGGTGTQTCDSSCSWGACALDATATNCSGDACDPAELASVCDGASDPVCPGSTTRGVRRCGSAGYELVECQTDPATGLAAWTPVSVCSPTVLSCPGGGSSSI